MSTRLAAVVLAAALAAPALAAAQSAQPGSGQPGQGQPMPGHAGAHGTMQGPMQTRFCADLVEAMVARGVLMNLIGAGRNILKIRPPMPFSLENADFLMDRLEAALTSTPVPA